MDNKELTAASIALPKESRGAGIFLRDSLGDLPR